jgi:hypothetical protein
MKGGGTNKGQATPEAPSGQCPAAVDIFYNKNCVQSLPQTGRRQLLQWIFSTTKTV